MGKSVFFIVILVCKWKEIGEYFGKYNYWGWGKKFSCEKFKPEEV